MTFIAGADSCLTGYFFLRAERIKKNKARSIALVTLIISIVSVVLYALRDTSTWIPGPYYGGGYSSECGLLTGYTKLRCRKFK
jgi:hypothetical protein